MDTKRPCGFTTAVRRWRVPRAAPFCAVAAAVVTLAGCSPRFTSTAPLASGPLDALVAWHRAGLVYVALGDSGSVAPGDTLRIRSGAREVAAAPIVSIAEGGMAVARLVSGSLAQERELDRLRVFAARVPLPSPSTLRVGFPSARRAALDAGCGEWTLRAPVGVAYRVEPLGRLGYRLTRASTDTLSAAAARDGNSAATQAVWPDTIVASLFDDAAEEEIALERGDLDIALFGPDELSARLRGSPRWGILRQRGGGDGDGSSLLAPAELVRYIRALGAAEILGMVGCEAGAGGP